MNHKNKQSIPDVTWLAYGLKIDYEYNELVFYPFILTVITSKTSIPYSISFTFRIDVIMLYEQYDASLLILKKIFYWDYIDVFYFKYNFGKYNHSIQMSKQVEAKILSPQIHFGDRLLYDALNETWWNQAEGQKEDFWEKVYHAGLFIGDV